MKLFLSNGIGHRKTANSLPMQELSTDVERSAG